MRWGSAREECLHSRFVAQLATSIPPLVFIFLSAPPGRPTLRRILRILMTLGKAQAGTSEQSTSNCKYVNLAVLFDIVSEGLRVWQSGNLCVTAEEQDIGCDRKQHAGNRDAVDGLRSHRRTRGGLYTSLIKEVSCYASQGPCFRKTT